jgi:hypothetical protein
VLVYQLAVAINWTQCPNRQAAVAVHQQHGLFPFAIERNYSPYMQPLAASMLFENTVARSKV